MTKFQFPLERVLELRRTQLELEEAKYRQTLAAVSRLTGAIATTAQRNAAQKMRAALAAYRDSEDLIQLGAYVAGSNAALDTSIRLRPELLEFLRQDHTTNCSREETIARLQELGSALEICSGGAVAKR